MEVRDAVEADAERMADLTGAPAEVMRNLVHDRTVRVAVEDPDADDMLGFVSFDAKRETVHVTQLKGEPAACDRLVEEPVSFARREGMAVELLVAGDDDQARMVADDAGFADLGEGPRFGGTRTVRYRREF